MWRAQAEELAILHVEEKYGFTPTVVDSKSNRGDSVVPIGSYVPQTIVTMSYEDRTFTVVAEGDDTTTDKVLDNYQEEEINIAFKEYVSNYLQVPAHDVYLESGRSVTLPGEEFSMQYIFYHEYFDGSNLQELLPQHSIRAYVKLVGDTKLDDLVTISKDSLVFHPKTELLITTHTDAEAADKCSLDAYFDKTGKDAYYVLGTIDTKSPELYIYYQEELLPTKPEGVTGYRMGVAYWDTAYDQYRYERTEGTTVEGYRVYETSLKNRDNVSFRLLFETPSGL